MRNFKLLLFSIISTISLSSYSQSGWTQEKGKYYVKISGQNTQSSKHFNQLGKTTKNSEFGIFSLGAYAEYGKTDKLTIIGFVPVFTNFNKSLSKQTNDNVFENIESIVFGDPEISAKLKLFKTNRIATALTGKLRIPLGGGEANHGITLSTGITLFNTTNFSTYINAYGGANNRPKQFSDEWRYGFEFGVGYKNKLWLFLKQDNIQSFENVAIDSEEDLLRVNELYGNHYSLKSINAEIAYYLTPKFGLSFSYLNTFDGKLVLKGSTFNGGVFWNLK